MQFWCFLYWSIPVCIREAQTDNFLKVIALDDLIIATQLLLPPSHIQIFQ